MKKVITILSALCWLMLSPARAQFIQQGDRITVINSDSIPSKSPTGPRFPSLGPGQVRHVPGDYSTIQEAIDASAAGDTVLVAAGYYFERIVINTNVTLLSESGAESTVINSMGYGGGSGSWAIEIFSPCRVSGFELSSSDPFTFGIMCFAPAVIEHNILAGFTYSGIYCHGSTSTPDIQYNLIRDNLQAGIIMSSSAAPDIFNNTVVNNADGIVAYTNSTPLIENNIIIGNQSGIGGFTGSTTMNSYNDIWNNGIDYDGASLSGVGDISLDPLFDGGDPYSFHIQASSPCIDAGNPSLPHDFDATIADIGAFYFPHTSNLTITDPMNDGWNMVSVPLFVNDYQKASIYPTALSPAFRYLNGYQKQDTLRLGGGYWVKFSTTDTVQYSGQSVLTDTVGVKAGWNIVGSISVTIPTSSITSIPGGISTSFFFGYTTSGYYMSDSIQPGRAYWVRVNADCRLVLSIPKAVVSGVIGSNKIRIVAGSELPPPPPERGMADGQHLTPKDFALAQNYPNPFNPSTVIDYQLPVNSHVTLKLYDLLGQEIKTLVDEMQDAGYKSVALNAHELASGMYYYRLVAGSFSETRKMLLVR